MTTARSDRSLSEVEPSDSTDLAPSVERHTYQALGTDEFRLLEVEPGHEDQPIRVQLFHASLLDPPPYHGLSYTWETDPPLPPGHLICNGCRVPVTGNLERALARFRSVSDPLVIWIDAICINQQDNLEKSIQVARMREIYSKAQHLYIWLGLPPSPARCDQAFHAVNTLVSWFGKHVGDVDLFFYNAIRLVEIHRHNMDQYSDELQALPLEPEHYQAVAELLSVRWFRRVWIVQEAISIVDLHGDRMTIAYGHGQMTWPTLTKLCNGMRLFPTAVEDQKVQANPNAQPEDFKNPWGLVRTVNVDPYYNRIVPVPGPEHIGPEELYHLPGLYVTGRLSQFYHFMNLTRRLQSTNPRDKIFAFYGMVERHLKPDERERLRPDYDKPIVDVYIDAILYFVLDSQCLDILELVDDQPSQSQRLAGLPAWANDWTQYSELELFHNIEFSAGGGSFLGHVSFDYHPQYAPGQRVLTLRIFIADVIQWHVPPEDEWSVEMASGYFEQFVDPQPFAEHPDLRNDVVRSIEYHRFLKYRDMLARARTKGQCDPDLRCADAPSLDEPYVAGGSLYEAFWRTLVCDTYQTGESPDETLGEAFDVYHDLMMTYVGRLMHPSAMPSVGAEQWDTFDFFQQEHLRYTRQRRFIVGQTGFLGWTPRSAAVGDLICIIPGARLPYILRPPRGPEDAGFRFVGHAFIHGLMSGIIDSDTGELTLKGETLMKMELGTAPIV